MFLGIVVAEVKEDLIVMRPAKILQISPALGAREDARQRVSPILYDKEIRPSPRKGWIQAAITSLTRFETYQDHL